MAWHWTADSGLMEQLACVGLTCAYGWGTAEFLHHVGKHIRRGREEVWGVRFGDNGAVEEGSPGSCECHDLNTASSN